MKDHLFGNLFCAIDTETTGLDDRQHEIIELAIIPLGWDIEPHPHHSMVNVYMRPDRIEDADPESFTVTGKTLNERMEMGLDQGVVLDLLHDWYGNLNLSPKSRIIPIAHNWAFDKGFLEKWIGREGFNDMFSFEVRDTMLMANAFNDMAWWCDDDVPFPRKKLRECCATAGIPMHSNIHSALEDAKLCMQLYKYMLKLRTLTRAQMHGT